MLEVREIAKLHSKNWFLMCYTSYVYSFKIQKYILRFLFKYQIPIVDERCYIRTFLIDNEGFHLQFYNKNLLSQIREIRL